MTRSCNGMFRPLCACLINSGMQGLERHPARDAHGGQVLQRDLSRVQGAGP